MYSIKLQAYSLSNFEQSLNIREYWFCFACINGTPCPLRRPVKNLIHLDSQREKREKSSYFLRLSNRGSLTKIAWKLQELFFLNLQFLGNLFGNSEIFLSGGCCRFVKDLLNGISGNAGKNTPS